MTDTTPGADREQRERVARAIWEAQRAHTGSGFPCKCGWEAGFGAGWEDRLASHRLYALAAAALAAARPDDDTAAALERVRALVDPEAGMATGNGYDSTRLFSERDIRAALDPS